MASESTIDKLITQCKSNDVDIKVDALTKLKTEIELSAEINDPDALVNVLKTCLRTPNQHLTSATLAVLPSLFSFLLIHPTSNPAVGFAQSTSSSTSSISPSGTIDVPLLRQVLTIFLSAGGIFDRLGDKEKAQLYAREALVILGALAFRSSPSSSLTTKLRDDKFPKPPIILFERALIDGGLASKVWKVREQSILILVHIRRKHHQFPIRPYLPILVDSLEDTDPHVRDCARVSVIELFTGPGVTDAARADLKEKMTKKGVRKGIVDSVLTKLLESGSNAQSQAPESGEGSGKAKVYLPPSMVLQQQSQQPTLASSTSTTFSRSTSQNLLKEAKGGRPPSRTAMSPPPPATPTAEGSDAPSVYIASTRDLENEFAAMAKPFEGKETEHNWSDRERAIVRVRGMLKGDVHHRYFDAFMTCLKEGFIQWSLKTLASLRTTVAVHTCNLYSELVIALGSGADTFCETLLTHLLKMAGFTKKITAQMSQLSVTSIILHASPQPRIILPLLYSTYQEKNPSARVVAIAHLKLYFETHALRVRNAIEGSGGVELLEKVIKTGVKDAVPAVREQARQMFWVLNDIWRDQAQVLFNTLEGSAKKEIEKVCPNSDTATGPMAVVTTTKKSSVAAAIAASRAKAKAIAAAPPTLRHQATSAGHAPKSRPMSPSSPKGPALPVNCPTSPLHASSSSSPPSTARVRPLGGRSVSTTAVPSQVRNTSPGSSGEFVLPPSPTERSTSKRRISSPLVSSSASPSNYILHAAQKALPASPPSLEHVSPTPRARGTSGLPRGKVAAPLVPRFSAAIPETFNDELLIAQSIPIPMSDDDSDESQSILSFTPLQKQAPKLGIQHRTFSGRSTGSKPAISNALSTDSVTDFRDGALVVEDALKARAEQAESAAERLLELVEPEDEYLQSHLPASLLPGSRKQIVPTTPKVKNKIPSLAVHQIQQPPSTPVNNRATSILQQAAAFQDSPVNSKRAPSLLSVLEGSKHESGWWLRRKKLLAQGSPLKGARTAELAQTLSGWIVDLEARNSAKRTLQNIALLCAQNPTLNFSGPGGGGYPLNPSPSIETTRLTPSFYSEIWETDKNFDRLFKIILQFLDESAGQEESEYGLIVLYEMLEHQVPYLEGREAELFTTLLRIRQCNEINVLEATNAIRDELATKIEPVYGLTTLHASLRAFSLEAPPPGADVEVKAATYAFGLMAVSKFILRLPAEIAEEELPRLKSTLIEALNNRDSLIVRESAAAAIIAAQFVLQDETHLFTLLDGLADDKKNLLTYLFDKHGARGFGAAGGPSREKLEKELRRLDTRTSTPMRIRP